MKKILVTDVVFPTQLSLWRICETASFIKEKGADIMVFKIDGFAGVKYTVDYEEMRDILGYGEYNIIIFDPRYNHLNKFNKRIDGTQWNGLFPASYIFTKKTTFDIHGYDVIYHIFLHCYREFNKLIEYPKNKQVIHLYPGGGFSGQQSIYDLHHEVKLISTNPKTSLVLSKLGITNYLECLGGTFFTREGIHPYKVSIKHKDRLIVAFASLGHSVEKGASTYLEITKNFKDKYPLSNVNFIAIGNYPFEQQGVEIYSPMPMMKLIDFYKSNVDILISIDTGIAFNGWPLGIEAALTGALLATTDPNNLQQYYDIPDNSLAIFDISNTIGVVDLIHNMDEDRIELFKRGNKCREFFSTMCSYENQQSKIFSYLSI